jgi:hypothetical protein
MTMFSRRAIQRMLDENAAWMCPDSVHRHVSALNNLDNKDVLATEWEVAVLNALSKVGTVDHEREFPGGAKPDIEFSSGSLHFIADITSVSDRGLDEQNPVEALEKELHRRVKPLRDRGIVGGFFLRIGEPYIRGFRGNRPVQLKLPPPHKWKTAIFGEPFREFAKAIIADPTVCRACHIQNAETDVQITYTHKGQSWGMTHALYTIATSKKRNPAFGALSAKASQLKRTNASCPRGIILCDGDCDLLRSRRSTEWDSFGLNEIVHEFLRQHTSVQFVLVLVIQHDGNTRSVGPEHLFLHPRLYVGRGGGEPAAHLKEAIERMVKVFPMPIKTAQNARYRLEWARRSGRWDQGSSHYGGMTVTQNKIKISARTVLELLAGTLDQRAFLELHSADGGTPFAYKLRQGRLIKDVKVVASDIGEDDDEWLEFEFGEPDPAVFKYRALNPSPDRRPE